MTKTASAFDREKGLQLAMELLRKGLVRQAGGQLTKVLRHDPDSVLALQLSGVVASELGKHAQAVHHFKRALELEPTLASAYMNLASAFERQDELSNAVATLRTALERRIGVPLCQVHLKMATWQQELCDWRDYDERHALLRNMLRASDAKVEGASFYSFLAWDDPSMHRECAKVHFGPSRTDLAQSRKIARAERRRIKIAYVSADFRRHPTSRLIPSVLEAHSREQYEIVAISLKASDGSRERRRIEEAVDTFIDAQSHTSKDIAMLMRKRGIDIAIDLMGHTRHSRPDIYLHRAAPIQVNYLGFPGTSGMNSLDYIIVDPFLATSELRQTASEKLVILPNCYQSNDDKRKLPDKVPSRSECGLPGEAFVFATFNDPRKITPHSFDVWMRILRRVEGSVLWLLGKSDVANDNLREAARRRDVEASRLIFAARAEPDVHVARLSAADLFLDTFPYTSHTTGSDLLWAGRPIVTMAGRSFPSRVCGSLLTTIGVPELITTSWRDYEELAVRLSCDRDLLHGLCARITDGREKSPLFDSRRFTRNLERAYEAMVQLSVAGKPPTEIDLSSKKAEGTCVE